MTKAELLIQLSKKDLSVKLALAALLQRTDPEGVKLIESFVNEVIDCAVLKAKIEALT